MVIGAGVTTIGNYAFFNYTSLASVSIPNSVTYIGKQALSYCSALTSINIPSSVTFISSGAFYDCSALTAINVAAANANYASEEGILFNKNKTTLINYPIGKTATEYTIPSSVTTIDTSAFSSCYRLTSVIIPNSLTKISAYTFYGAALSSVSIPSSVTVIEYSAFENCTALTSVYNYAATPQSMNTDNRNTDVFKGVTISNVSLYVCEASAAAYRAAEVWQDFSIKVISGSNCDNGGTAVATEALPKLSIYPNPVGDMLYISDDFAGVVEICDLAGTLVLTAASNAINISSLPSGIYVVKAGGRAAKVVKQ